jgi:hypothetical protein
MANAIMYGRVSRGRQATAWSKPLTDMQRRAFDRMSWGFTVGLGTARSAGRGVKVPAGRHEWQPIQVSKLLAA